MRKSAGPVILWITPREERLVCLGANMHPIFPVKFSEIKWTDDFPQIQFLTMIACRPENLHWYAQSNGVRFEVRFFLKILYFMSVHSKYSILSLFSMFSCLIYFPIVMFKDSSGLPTMWFSAPATQAGWSTRVSFPKSRMWRQIRLSSRVVGWKRNMTFGEWYIL